MLGVQLAPVLTPRSIGCECMRCQRARLGENLKSFTRIRSSFMTCQRGGVFLGAFQPSYPYLNLLHTAFCGCTGTAAWRVGPNWNTFYICYLNLLHTAFCGCTGTAVWRVGPN